MKKGWGGAQPLLRIEIRLRVYVNTQGKGFSAIFG
jgi:hypothetical protein